MATKSGEANLEKVFVWSALVAAMLRFATPLLFGALGGIMSERSGVINVGLEGMMLMGAFFGIFGADVFGSWFVGVLVGVAAGGVLGFVHAVFSIALRADQVVSGVAVNFLAAGITGYVFIAHYGDQGTPGEVPSVPDVSLPLIKDIAFIGDAIGEMSLLTWVALLLVPVMARLPLPDPGRAAPALGRGEAARGRQRGHPGDAHALPGGDRLGLPGGAGRRLPVAWRSSTRSTRA